MAEHESCIGQSDEWLTPPEIFAALNMTFDLDPCAPLPPVKSWVPAWRHFDKSHNGLIQKWEGSIFMNPPFGNRLGHLPWLKKFQTHKNGIAIVRAYTSSYWWHEYMPKMDAIVFPKGKTKFIRPDGIIGKQPGHGIALASMGSGATKHLKNSNLGMFWDLRNQN